LILCESATGQSSQRGDVPGIIFLGSPGGFQDKGQVLQQRVIDQSPESGQTDVPLADVPVPINRPTQRDLGIIGVDDMNAVQADRRGDQRKGVSETS